LDVSFFSFFLFSLSLFFFCLETLCDPLFLPVLSLFTIFFFKPWNFVIAMCVYLVSMQPFFYL
jgi:hypothetical protein